MPCEILVVAVGKPGVTEKGYPWIIKDAPCVWGNKERLPNWVIVRITDATKAQAEHYLESWQKEFVHEILQDHVMGYRVKVSVDPAFISASGANKELKARLKTDLVRNWGVSIVSYENYEVVFDIPKPVDLQALKAHVYDVFSERVDTRFYYFSSEDVDLALAQGGYIELTKAQVLNRIKNKLDE